MSCVGNGCYSPSNVESNKSKCCPALPGAWVPANAGTHAEPLGILYNRVRIYPRPSIDIHIYADCFFEDWTKDLVRTIFRLRLSMGFSELEFLGQIAPFERRLPYWGWDENKPCPNPCSLKKKNHIHINIYVCRPFSRTSGEVPSIITDRVVGHNREIDHSTLATRRLTR